MKKICQFISKYMGVLVFAAAVLAFVFPDTLSKIRPTVINYLLGVVMFGMGALLQYRLSAPLQPASSSLPHW